jgi:hypothetical protein
MNIIKNYYNIIENLLNNLLEENDCIMFIINEEFNILEYFSHIIKKKNILIYILVTNTIDASTKIYNNLIKNIKGEECEKNIKILKDIKTENSIYKYIYIFDLLSISFLDEILKNITYNINKDSKLFLYTSFNNCSIENIKNKNLLINCISTFSTLKLNNIVDLKSIINVTKENDYTILSISKYLTKTYILIGDYTIYKIEIYKN